MHTYSLMRHIQRRHFMQNSNTGPSPFLRKAIILAMGLSFISGNTFADSGTANPVPTTYTDQPVPQLTKWNRTNVDTKIVGVDGYTGATSASYIYKDEAAKNSGTAHAHGAIFWELDNGSGRAPGVQVVTDNLDFPTKNCIMASGEMPDPK